MRLTGVAVRRQTVGAVPIHEGPSPAAFSLAAGGSAQWTVVCCHSTPQHGTFRRARARRVEYLYINSATVVEYSSSRVRSDAGLE